MFRRPSLVGACEGLALMTIALIIYLLLGLISFLRVFQNIRNRPPQAIIIIALWHLLIGPIYRIDIWFHGAILRGLAPMIEAPIRWAVSIK